MSLTALRKHGIGLLIVAFGFALLLPGLTTSELQPWDEGTYGDRVQTMREHGRYLFTVNESGEYATAGLSKPPLFLWLISLSHALFGNGLLGLRFASVFFTIGIAFLLYAYGRRMAPGHPLGLGVGCVAAIVALTAEGSFQYGQSACIEPVLTFWCLLTLLLYGEAMAASPRRGVLLAAAAGVSIGAAFLTKQLACAVAVIPLVLTELVWLLESRRVRPALVRLGAAAIPSITIAATWTWMAYRTVGSKLFSLFFQFSIQSRVAGFGGRKHVRWLNRMAHELDLALDPFPWELGLLGVGCLAGVAAFSLGRRDAEAEVEPLVPVASRRAFYILPLAYAAGWIAIYGNVSRSLLKWYTVGLLFTVALGLGFLVAGALFGWRRTRQAVPEWSSASALAGAAVASAAITASRVLQPIASRLNFALVLAAVIALAPVLAWLWNRTRRPWRAAVAPWLLPAALAITTLVLWARRTPDVDPLHAFVRELGERDARSVWIDRGFLKGGNRSARVHAYFGTTQVQTGSPPWQRSKRKRSRKEPAQPRAALVKAVIPKELREIVSVDFVQFPGHVALFGDLDTYAYTAEQMEAALDRGPISVEAEDQSSDVPYSVRAERNASGGLVRAFPPWWTSSHDALTLSEDGPIRVPKGRYTANFLVRYQCTDIGPSEKIMTLHVDRESHRSGSSKTIQCTKGSLDEYEFVSVSFTLDQEEWIAFRVEYRNGTIWHDKTDLVRRGATNSTKKQRPGAMRRARPRARQRVKSDPDSPDGETKEKPTKAPPSASQKRPNG